MTQYTADPRAEELHLLRQINRQNIHASHSSTLATAHRLQANAEAFIVHNHLGHPWVQITTKGRRAIGAKDHGET